MKANLLILTLSTALLSSCSSSYLAQNSEYDGVYDPGGDVVDTYAYVQEEEQQPDADFDYVDPNFDPSQQTPYEYSSRIRRFHSNSSFGYYDPYYTNMGWYDSNPNNYGTSIYSDAWVNNNYYSNSNWSTFGGWNSYSGWNWGVGYSWGWGNASWAYGPMWGYNPWYSPYYAYNPWNPWSPWNCPGYYNSYDVMSQVVYTPRGQNRPESVGYTQNAYESAVRRGDFERPELSDDLIASTDRAVPSTPRTVKNERPSDVNNRSGMTDRVEIPSQSGRAVTKAIPNQIVSRDVETRANNYLRQKADYRNGGFPRTESGSNTVTRGEVPRFLQNFESLINGTESSRPTFDRGYVPSLNQNQGRNFERGNSTPSWNGGNNSSPSFNGGSTPRFNIGGGNRGGGSSGGSRGGSSGGSSGGSRGGSRR